jgi:uncharacterized protein (TIGR03032 family)
LTIPRGYVTALGQTDTAGGWRPGKARGGCLLDIESGEPVIQGLSMPHSPRYYDDRLWWLESGEGTLARLDPRTGCPEVVAQLPGFTRGLDFCGPYAFIGLSQVRETAEFGGLPITERLRERVCGVWVVHIESGETVAYLRFDGDVREVFAVQILPDLCYPELLVEDGDVLANCFVLPEATLAETAR